MSNSITTASSVDDLILHLTTTQSVPSWHAEDLKTWARGKKNVREILSSDLINSGQLNSTLKEKVRAVLTDVPVVEDAPPKPKPVFSPVKIPTTTTAPSFVVAELKTKLSKNSLPTTPQSDASPEPFKIPINNTEEKKLTPNYNKPPEKKISNFGFNQNPPNPMSQTPPEPSKIPPAYNKPPEKKISNFGFNQSYPPNPMSQTPPEPSKIPLNNNSQEKKTPEPSKIPPVYNNPPEKKISNIGLNQTSQPMSPAPLKKSEESIQEGDTHSFNTRMGESSSEPTPTGRPLFIFSSDYKSPLLTVHDAARAAMGLHWTPKISSTLEGNITTLLQSEKVRNFMSEMGIDANEAGAVTYYTSDVRKYGGKVEQSLYFLLNKTLSSRGIPENWKPFLFYLLRAVDKLPNMETTVYRAFDKPLTQLSKQYRDNNTIVWIAFTSTSARKEMLKSFSESVSFGTWIQLKVTQGKNIAPLSLYPSEGEVLLLPNSTFKVTQVLKEDTKGLLNLPQNMDIITMEQLPSKDGLMVLPNPFAAVFQGNLEDLKKWHRYEQGASLAILDIEHNSAPLLYTAASNGHLDVVLWLISQNVDVNATQKMGSTSLHGAGFYGHLEICKVLLENGIDVGVVNKWGKTAYDEVSAQTQIREQNNIGESAKWAQIRDLIGRN